MSKHKTHSGNSPDNANQNLSPEKLEQLTNQEMERLKTVAIDERLPAEGQEFAHGILNDFKYITESNLLKIIILILFINISNSFNGLWHFDFDMNDTTGITAIGHAPKNQIENSKVNTNNSNNKESIVKTKAVLLKHHRPTYLSENINVEKELLSLASPPESVADCTKDNIVILENAETHDPVLINNNKTVINDFTINIRKGNWSQLSSERLKSDNSTEKSEIITIKSFKGKEITLLSSLINGYLKTNMLIKKGMVLYISSNGSISTINNNMEYKPGGLADIPINSPDEPLIGEYHLGALLFRIGEEDHWKPYSASQPKIVAEKDGRLEFMINFKASCANFIKGNYAVGVSTNQNEVD